MDFRLLQFNPGLVTALAFLGAAVGIAVWFFIRKRRLRVWLPTLRVLDFDNEKMPKLRFVLPPWLAFLAYFCSAVAMAFLAFQPVQKIFTPFRPDQNRIHIFLDLSASLKSHVSIDKYAAKASELFEQLAPQGRLSISTSHSEVLFEPQTKEEVVKQVMSLDYHRAGLKLGEALKKQTPLLGDVNKLFIVSDGDRHSWDDLNWSFLSEEMEIFFSPVADPDSSALANFYINQAQYVASADTNYMEWEIEVAANQTFPKAVTGNLQVLFRGKTLTSTSWSLPEGRERASVRIQWPAQDVYDTSPQAIPEPLVWRLQTDHEDNLDLDNEYRSHIQGIKQDVLLVAEPLGEMFLEDPAHHLEVALDVLGFNIKRIDRVDPKKTPPVAAPLWVLLGGLGKGTDNFCPKDYTTMRLNKRTSSTKLPLVWLAPYAEPANYQELCQCFTRLVLSKEGDTAMPTYCEDLQTRDQWVGVLNSLGAKQIGGDVGDLFGSLAFNYKDKDSGAEVLAFTVPLRPRLATGIRYADLPRLIHALLGWEGLVQDQSALKKESWPRILDISVLPQEKRGTDITLSNVPQGESMLVTLDAALLPPRWDGDPKTAPVGASAKKDDEDPLPWIQLVSYIILGAALIEFLGSLLTRLAGMKSRKSSAALIVLFGLFFSNSGKAEIQLNMVGYQAEGLTAHRLSREVEGRTSIDLDPNLFVRGALDEKTFQSPWMWAENPRLLMGRDGAMDPKVMSWLQRGGFLIIEDTHSTEVLDKLTGKGFPILKVDEGWTPIPPDHELMRSFHLLDSLPACPGQVWRGFHYDGRLAILAIPHSFIESIFDQSKPIPCLARMDHERGTRVFVNLLMVALATDYKKDQIHLPEILKRLR